jgi:hypothetical protein
MHHGKFPKQLTLLTQMSGFSLPNLSSLFFFSCHSRHLGQVPLFALNKALFGCKKSREEALMVVNGDLVSNFPTNFCSEDNVGLNGLLRPIGPGDS